MIKMANWKKFTLKGVLLFQLLQTILTDGHVSIQVQILQYDNSLGTSFHKIDTSSQRKCCDGGHLPSCSSTDTCDSNFLICIGGIRNGACIGPSVTTAALNNKNAFTTSYDNTIVHSFTWNHWQSGALEYIADVFDKDDGNKELIDNFTSTTALHADLSYENSTTQILSFKNFVSLDVGIRIWCQDGYSGHDCSTKCTDNTYSICTNNNGHALLKSCSSDDVSTFKLNPGSLIPVNYTPLYLQQLVTQFFLQQICSDAHDVNVEILHFDIEGLIEFKATCDNKTQSSLLFTEHIYILSLTNKAALGKYFPNIPLLVPSVHKQLPRGSKMLIMLRPIRYHDSTTQCGRNGCNVQITVCLKASSNGNCLVTISMQSILNSSLITICDGALLKSTPALQGHNIVSVSTWPVFQVDASYDKQNIKWHNLQQPPATYKARALYDKAKPFQMTFSSGGKSLILESMIWCDSSHSGDQCQHSCRSSGNKICDKNGHAVCKTGYSGNYCSDINECQGSNPCKNGGTCHNTQGSFTCQCQPYWTGRLCDVDVDECSLGLCTNATSCSNSQGGFHCHCGHGFRGRYCEETDECKLQVNVCQHNSTCMNQYGSYSCICPPGYTGSRCERDIDECQQQICGPHSINCTNTDGNFTCKCNNGWEGKTCKTDVNISTSSSTSDEKYTTSESSAFTASTVQYLTRKETSEHITSFAGETSTLNNNTTTNETIRHLLTTEQQKTSVLSQTTTPTLQYTDLNSTKMYIQSNITTKESSTTKVQLLLEDAISPKCSSSGWNITLDIPTLTKLYPEIKINQVHFGDNSCKGKVIGAKLVFIQGFRECLTVERISGDTILYNNKLFYAIYDPIHPYIIRQHKWTYGVECDINRNEVTSSHVHHNVETHNSVLSGQYSVNMTFFKDPGYINQLPGDPLQIKVGDDVYVKVFTTASDWNIKMRLHTCFTKPNMETTNMTYYIIKNGCEVDSNTHIISQSTHETRFVFQDFEYSTNEEGLNIYCNATFCASKDYSAGCSQSCIPDN